MEPTANAGMSVSDWSSLVAMVVAICALFSPALTAFFNNQHQLEMKKLEYEHQESENAKYMKVIFELPVLRFNIRPKKAFKPLESIRLLQCTMFQKNYALIWFCWKSSRNVEKAMMICL